MNSARIQAIEKMEKLVGTKAWSQAEAFFTENVAYRVGARQPVYGLAGIRDYMTWQDQYVRWEGHSPRLMLEHDNTVIIEVDSHFKRLQDNTAIIVPCTDIYRFEGDKIKDWRVYADYSGFFDSTVELDS
ncbi:MAG: nuclear transport factor 2 family protein [Deinococcota bacterium]